jgi:heme A synthase
MSVVWHWGTAMAFVASLASMAIFSFTAQQHYRGDTSPLSATLTIALSATAVIAFATMCIGAYVSSSGAGLACRDIPECAGNVVVYTPGQYVQMLHRFIAAACLLASVVSFTFVWALGASTRVRVTATLGLGLVFVQIVLGLLNVALRLPIDLREAHAANAALVFLSFVCAAAFSALESSSGQTVEQYARTR